MNVDSQHRHIAFLQAHWRGNALKDMRYNLNRARVERKAGNNVLASGYAQEARWDKWWADRRGRVVKRERGY